MAGAATIRRALISGATTVALALAGAAPAAAQECAGAGAQPDGDNADVIRDAVVCLVNRERRQAGLPSVDANAKLAKAARRHSGDMVDRRYFDHRSPGGADMADRALKVGYISRTRSWALAENLAWGSGSRATPRSIVQMWMESPPHRANVLRSGVREAGLGVAVGTPRGGSRGGTYTLLLGRRGS